MLGKLYEYLWWKSALAKEQAAPAKLDPKRPTTSEPMSEALRRKNQEIANRQQNRRRVRGGAPGGGSGREESIPPVKAEPKEVSVSEIQDEAFVFKQFRYGRILRRGSYTHTHCSQKHSRHGPPNLPDLDLEEELDFDDDFGFGEYYGVIAPEETVVVRKYGDDSDDRMLEDLRPKSVILYEPNLDFIRRIEVGPCALGCRSFNADDISVRFTRTLTPRRLFASIFLSTLRPLRNRSTSQPFNGRKFHSKS